MQLHFPSDTTDPMVWRGELPQLRCRDCQHKLIGACRRLDWKIIVPAHPYFRVADAGGNMICADFEPQESWTWLLRHWQGFDIWYADARRCWGTLTDPVQRGAPFGVMFRGNEDRRTYYLPLDRWIYGKPVMGGILRAQWVSDAQRGRSYILRTIDGVPVDALDSEGGDPDV